MSVFMQSFLIFASVLSLSVCVVWRVARDRARKECVVRETACVGRKGSRELVARDELARVRAALVHDPQINPFLKNVS